MAKLQDTHGPNKLPRGALGRLPLPPRWGRLLPAMERCRITGGPFRVMPDGFYGVCLLEHFNGVWDGIHMPIQDFGVPTRADKVNEALLAAYAALLDGRDLWVGCAGAKGRTGLFLALMAKAAGAIDPVDYVRSHYHAHAVETKEQEDYVANFDVKAVRRALFWHQLVLRHLGRNLSGQYTAFKPLLSKV